MGEHELFDIEEAEARVDLGDGEIKSYPNSDQFDDFTDGTNEVFVGRVDYDSGGSSSLDGTTPIVIRTHSEHHEGEFPEMDMNLYLDNEQARALALRLLHECQSGSMDGEF